MKHDLKKVIAPLCIKEFPTLVEKVKMAETFEKSDGRVIMLIEEDHLVVRSGYNHRSHKPDLHSLELEQLHLSLGHNSLMGVPDVTYVRRRGILLRIVQAEK